MSIRKVSQPEKEGSHQFDSGGRSGEENARSSHAPRAPTLAPAEPDARFLPVAAAGPASGYASDGPGCGGIESEASRPPHIKIDRGGFFKLSLTKLSDIQILVPGRCE